ncbi:MAG: alpha-galactosidase [Ruminococcaceae bacterium]|nr:alpha-galactosidase [Oscillospiraceae bacterium]
MNKKKIASWVLGASAGVALGKKINKQSICPACVIKKAFAGTQVHVTEKEAYNNGVALTPPMGWSSWNTFRNTIDESLIKDTAAAMKKTGLLDAGYKYINLDDCWQSSMRTADGKLQGDLTRFPRGMKPLIEEINDLGFKVGLYTSNGTLTCEDLPASLYNEATDADTLAEWGVEYFKYDFCHNEAIPTVAPSLIKIYLGKPGESDFIEMFASHGNLSKGAKVMEDDRVEGGYVVGNLCGGLGELVFDTIEVPEDGDYSLTIVFRKGGNMRKFLVCLVNGKEEYDCYFPSSKGFTADGRLQIVISLKKGINTLKFYNPVASRMDSAQRQYINMGKELKRATKEFADKNNTPEKPICYSICEWGMNQPWKWGAKAGNLWRTTHDIKPFWASMLLIYEFNVRLYKHSAPGSWNDPDMLEVGVGKLTMEENKTHFSLWCMMAAPLILGNDVRKFINEDGTVDEDNKVLNILKNKNLIAVDQDKRGKQAKRIQSDIVTDILAKPLENRELAICFFNKSASTKNITLDIQKIHNDPYCDLPFADCYEITELWDNTSETIKTEISAAVPAHGVKVYKVKAI